MADRTASPRMPAGSSLGKVDANSSSDDATRRGETRDDGESRDVLGLLVGENAHNWTMHTPRKMQIRGYETIVLTCGVGIRRPCWCLPCPPCAHVPHCLAGMAWWPGSVHVRTHDIFDCYGATQKKARKKKNTATAQDTDTGQRAMADYAARCRNNIL